MGNMGVTNMKSGDYHFLSISSITCWPFTYGILNMVELVLCLIIPRFLPFLEYKFVKWFCLWNFCIGYMCLECFFCISVCPFISLYANVAGYPSKNDAIIFRKSVHFI